MRPGPRDSAPAASTAIPAVPDYVPDILTNYELGWKSRWADDRLQFNAAVFLEEWDNIQVAFQGLNGITQVENGPEAEIKGTEMQLDWLATDNLRAGHSRGAYYDSELTSDYALRLRRGAEGAGRNSVADHRGVQGQRDRALHVPAGRIRGARTGIARLRRRAAPPTSTSTTPPRSGGKSRGAHSSTSRSASKTTNMPSSCFWRMPRMRMRRNSSMPSVPLACAAARPTAWSRGRGRSASDSSRTSDQGREPIGSGKGAPRGAPFFSETFESGNDSFRRLM